MTYAQYNRNVASRYNSRRFKAIKKTMAKAGEILGAILVGAMMVALGWLFLMATPDQMSAECDRLTVEMGQ